MTYPNPTYVGTGPSHQMSPVTPTYLVGVTGAGGLLATYGGRSVPQDSYIQRAFVHGPVGSHVDLYVGDSPPEKLVLDRRYQVDYTLTGSFDYANYAPPLFIPAGWFAVFFFSGGSTPTGGATVRLETRGTGGD